MSFMSILRSLFLTASVTSGSTAGSDSLYKGISTIEWAPCNVSIADPSLSCGFFPIPLDYHNVSAGSGTLAVIKANATGARRGTVFMNPGGPGVSGLAELNSTVALLLNQTGGEYDIVSWDPRGVGALTAPGDVFCFDSTEEQFAFFNGTIEMHGIEMFGNFTDPTDLNTLRSQAPVMQEKYTTLGEKCLARTEGRYLQYVGTAATVRDLVALADTLDGPGSPVNFIGLSYGTIVGSWLVNMFPERVGRVVLDGVVDPELLASEDISLGWSQQLSDADTVFKGFFTGCALAGPERCNLTYEGQTPIQVNGNIQSLLMAARDAWYANASAPVSSGSLRFLLRPSMYNPASWPSLSTAALPQIVSEIETLLAAPYSTPAILCSDSTAVNTGMSTVLEGVVSTSRNVSHMFGAAWPFATFYCPFWPVRAVEQYTGPFNKTLKNHILVIGNTYDPVTPFFGAKAVADEHGSQAALVRMNGFGHTSQAALSACLNGIIRQYMADGTLPENGETTCEVDDDFEIWPGVNTKMIMDAMPSGHF